MTKRQRKLAQTGIVEVVASFSFKLNCGQYPGGAQYESADFFVSQKTRVPANEAEKAAQTLRTFAKHQVMEGARQHIAELASGAWARELQPHKTAQANAEAFERHQRNHAKGASN